MEAAGATETDPEPVKYLSVTTASAEARVANETIRKWFDTGEITGTRTVGGHRRIEESSLRRRLGSLGISEAVREAGRSEATIRTWFDQGIISGYLTPAGRRRIYRHSLQAHLEYLDRRL